MSTAEPTGKPANETEPVPPSTLTEIFAAIRGITTRLDILERRFEYLDRDVLKAIDAQSEAVLDADPDPGPPSRRVPAFALTSDGRLLLSAIYLEGADLNGRERWTGVTVSEAEACDALDAFSDAADDIAGHVAGRILWNKKKKQRSEGTPSEPQ